jgi:geranylgeranyl transferase type-1 subunit beta
MTYAALLALAILRDPFTALDREGILRYLKLSQREDGRCAHLPIYGHVSPL